MKISIVTIVLNDKENIEKTILSVVNQNIILEYIIVDGGSTDGTIDIIEKHQDKINIFVSEKDDGIYDAMNRAIDVASGDWICFMNSGDTFVSSHSVQEIFDKQKNKKADILYGDNKIKYPTKVKLVQATNIEYIWKGSVFSHQSCFVKRELLLEHKFNVENKIIADYELFYTLYKQGKVFEHVPVVVASVSSGGVSDVKRIESIVSRWKILDRNIKINAYYAYLVISEILKKTIKILLGRG